MAKQRSRYSAQFKFQLTLEAAKGLKTINELASEHGVHPNEDIYLNDDVSVPALAVGLDRYFMFYSHERPHQSLAYWTPAEAHGKQ